MRHSLIALLLAAFALSGCVVPDPSVAGRIIDPFTGAVTDAQPTRLPDGSTGWLVDCTPNQTFCAQRANLLCGTVAKIELLAKTDPAASTVVNTGSGVAVPASSTAVYSTRATC